jgi:hypothetical protein
LRSTVTATGGGGSLETALSMALNTSFTVTVGAGGASPNRSTVGGTGNSQILFFLLLPQQAVVVVVLIVLV